jgi:biopolymer transport protein ExbB
MRNLRHVNFRRSLAAAVGALFLAGALPAHAWWNEEWTGRTKLILNTAVEGAEIKGDAGESVVLVRLHPGNVPFEALQPDGSDLRFVAADDQTPLSFHLEKFDPLMAEGFAWVRLPAVSGATPNEFWLYYGNAAPGGEGQADAAKTYPETTKFVYHLNERGTPPQDATANAANAETAGSLSEGTVIADGVRLIGREPIKIPAAPANEWAAGGELSLILWVKPVSTAKEAILFARPESDGLRLGLAAGGAPFVEIAGQPRAVAGPTLGDGVWRQLALTAKEGRIVLWLDGVEAATLDAPLPAGRGPIYLGGPDPAAGSEGRFLGEFDELQVHGAALSAAALKLLFINQSGSELAAKILTAEQGEAGGGGEHGGMLEHVMLFGDIANNMMFDGWIAVVVCVIMMIMGWSVAVAKFVRLRALMRGDAEFLRQWGEVSGDLTVLDADDPDSLTNLRMEAMDAKGASKQKANIRRMLDSPCYHLYHLGVKEIRHRISDPDRHRGLSVRSIQAIRASLDAGMVRERQRLNKGLVILTTSIAGGPYVGLLGTVVGVMITFAIIAKSGEVDVNSIAPGIASALLATTVGLFVAIPALFMYSVLSSRIKDVLASMHVFIDEFVTKIAEAYPPPGEGLPPRYAPASAEAEPAEANLN